MPRGDGKRKNPRAFLAPALTAPDNSAGLQVLWLTPLRALARDLASQLESFGEALGLSWRIAVRNGDSTAKERRQLRQALPEVLVTTPESLSILLASPNFIAQAPTLKAVIVDEWHALLGTKRGVLLELALARLDSLAPKAQRWGLSATVADPEHALGVLLGPERRGRLIQGPRAPCPR